MVLALARPHDDDAVERERRYVLGPADAAAFFAAAGPHLVARPHDPSRPRTWIRTTYLDTDDYAYLRTLDSPVARRLRVREYASSANDGAAPRFSGACTLELKESAASARAKARLSAPPAVIERLLEENGDPGSIADLRADPSVLGLLRPHLQRAGLAPRVASWYRRQAFEDKQGLVRVTLDMDLRFALPEPIAAAGQLALPGRVIGRGPGRILEIKVRGPAPAWLERARSGLKELECFSKFRYAMIALLARRGTTIFAWGDAG